MKKLQKQTSTTSPEASAMVVMDSIRKDAQGPLRKVTNLTILSQADFDQAGDLLRTVKQLAAQAKDKEDSLTQPLTKVIKDIRVLFKPFRDQVTAIEEDTKSKMLHFISTNKAKQEKITAAFEDGKIKKVSTVVEKVSALDVHANTAQIRKTWTAIEVDAAKTPHEYMVPDMVAIREALKAGKVVSGWKWEQVETIAI